MMDMLNTPPESMHESKMRSLRASFEKDEEEASAKDMTRITGGAGGTSKVQRGESYKYILVKFYTKLLKLLLVYFSSY